jgi:hypothetical protein
LSNAIAGIRRGIARKPTRFSNQFSQDIGSLK